MSDSNTIAGTVKPDPARRDVCFSSDKQPAVAVLSVELGYAGYGSLLAAVSRVPGARVSVRVEQQYDYERIVCVLGWIGD